MEKLQIKSHWIWGRLKSDRIQRYISLSSISTFTIVGPYLAAFLLLIWSNATFTSRLHSCICANPLPKSSTTSFRALAPVAPFTPPAG